jgi:hypothetical protein
MKTRSYYVLRKEQSQICMQKKRLNMKDQREMVEKERKRRKMANQEKMRLKSENSLLKEKVKK